MKKKKATLKYVLNSRLKARLNEKEEETFPLYIQITYNGKVSRFPFPFSDEVYLSKAKFNNIEKNENFQYYHKLAKDVLDYETGYGILEEISFSDFHSKILIYNQEFNTILAARAAFLLLEFAKDNLTYRQYQYAFNSVMLTGIREKGNEYHVSYTKNSWYLIGPFLGILSEQKIKLTEEVCNGIIAIVVGHFFEEKHNNSKNINDFKCNIYSWKFVPEFKTKLEYFAKNLISLDRGRFNFQIEISGPSEYNFDMEFFREGILEYLEKNKDLNYYELIKKLINTSSSYLDLGKNNLTAF